MRNLGVKALAGLVLLVCAWILLKIVIGVVTTLAWIVVVVLAVMGVIWALSMLRR